MCQAAFDIILPTWVGRFIAGSPEKFPTPEERMSFVISLARENVIHGTGGPFGAAIFDEAGHLTAPGINLVTAANSSILHAEIVAIALAQKKLKRYDIGDAGTCHYELATSAEPCAMCLGAIPWSGVTSLICGASDEDARRIGFDEGAKPFRWEKTLEERGIKVTRKILRAEAVAVLNDYQKSGGQIYNTGKTKQP